MAGIKVSSGPIDYNDPVANRSYVYTSEIVYDVLNEDYLQKVELNGTKYILSSWEDVESPYYEGKKIAFSIHGDNILDDYQMEELYERLTTDETLHSLSDIADEYIIYAL